MYKYAAVLAMSFSLAACQTAAVKIQESAGIELSRDEVMNIFPDATAEWSNGKGRNYWKKDGVLKYQSYFGTKGEGVWRVSDQGDMCLTVKEWAKGKERCFDIWREADGSITSIYPDGKAVKIGEIMKGNQLK